jgi:prolyl oligopeptidase
MKIALISAGVTAALAIPLFSAPPPTSKKPVEETLHGVKLVDNYRWLEDQDSPQTRAWLNEQIAYTKSVLGKYAGREALMRRAIELNRAEALTTPSQRNGRYFFRRRAADAEQYVVMTREGLAGKDDILLDPAKFSKDPNTSVVIEDISLDAALVAYGIREGGKDELRVRFRQVATKEDLRDELPEARYMSVSIKPDKSGYFYATSGDDKPRVYERNFDEPHPGREIFGQQYGAKNLMYTYLSDDGRWLVIVVIEGSAADKVDVFVKDAKANAPIRPLITGMNARFQAFPAGDRFFVMTNYQAARNRIVEVDPARPQPEHWREVIPEQKYVMDGFAAVGGRLLVLALEDVKSKLLSYLPSGKFEREIPLPAIGSVSSLSGEWSNPELFYSFTSFHIPQSIYRADLAAKTQAVWNQTKLPIHSAALELKQVFYPSKDGTRIPMFLLHKKGLKLDGTAPTILTGYGGFMVSNTPSLSITAVMWAERGGVFALANLRGGGEYGEDWHKAGMLANKQNVFDDFIAASEWLIANQYTSTKRLGIYGGSNGGLLVGAAMVQRPDLYQAVVCAVPLLDMLRYDKFLVARFWVPEYGTADNAEQFPYLLKYSPYQNVKKGTKYPAVMFKTGDGDTRVAPLHARKMTALVQDATASDRPVVLLYDLKAGHSAGMGVSQKIEETADIMQFLSGQLGLAVQ